MEDKVYDDDIGLEVRLRLGRAALSFSDHGAGDPTMPAEELFAAMREKIRAARPR